MGGGHPNQRPQAAVWEDGVLTYLASPDVAGVIESFAYAVSPRGEIVGVIVTSTGTVGVLWEDGTPIVLASSGGPVSNARAINAAGDIVGSASFPGSAAARARMWRHEDVVDLGTLPGGFTSDAQGINARRQVVGCAQVPSGNVAFLWERGTMTNLGTLGGRNSCAVAINARGQVVGWSETASGSIHAFIWGDGVMTSLGTLPGGDFSYATAINNRGQIVGYSGTATPWYHAFLWEDGVMTDLGALPGGDTFSRANGISESGQIVGRISANWARWTVR